MKIKQFILGFLVAFFTSLSLCAQIRGNEIRVVVSPDHTDWVYSLKEKVRFHVQVFKAQNLLPGVVIDYELGPEMYPEVKSGAVISAVDLIRGIGHYAGLRIIKVEGATGLYNTNYEGKAQAAIDALRHDDFVFVHVEASDEAGHDGDLNLKLQTIENLDRRIVEPIYNEVKTWDEPVCIAVLPDHPTPVEVRTHVQEPVPFVIYYPGIEPDDVKEYDEVSCVGGAYGMLRLQQFMQEFMKIK